MPRPTRETRTRYVVLGILMRGEATGYQIQKAIQESTAFFWNESYGQLYPTLSKLARTKLVSRRIVRGSARRERRYSITDEGRDALKEWLLRPFQPAPERHELLLKVFFGNVHRPEVTAEHVRHALAQGTEMLAALGEVQATLKRQVPDARERFFHEATVRYGIAGTEAHVRWCQEVLADLETFR